MKETNFTPEQEAAIRHRDGALLVSAAAGSGKTKVLVERLLAYIDEGYNIDEFLVITYTRASAYELRERIYEAFQERLAENPGNLRIRRQSMLCRGSYIDTIHAFCTTILRENAHLVGLPTDFRVLDDSESNMIKLEIIDKVLNTFYEEVQNEKELKKLIDNIIDGRDDKRLSEMIITIYDKLQSVKDPHSWIDDHIKSSNLTDVKNITDTEYGKYYLNRLINKVTCCYNTLINLRKVMRTYPEFEQKYLSSIDISIAETDILLTSLKIGWDNAHQHRNIEFPRPGGISGYDELKNIRIWCRDELRKNAVELETSSQEHIKDAKELSLTIETLLQLVVNFDKEYSAEKKSRGAVDFSDLEHLTIPLLYIKNTSEKTAIARNLGKRFKEIMIDEYQDVNEVQESIFTALSADGNNIFMVGDVKQSIYRFRLADPTIFLNKHSKYKPYKQHKASNINVNDSKKQSNSKVSSNLEIGTKIHLSKNFRSKSGILDIVNLVFDSIMSKSLGEIEYTDSEKLVPGRVEIQCKQGKRGKPYQNEANADNEENTLVKLYKPVEVDLIDMATFEDIPDEENPKAIEIEAKHVAQRIKELLEAPYMIPDEKLGKRPIECSDIAILSRSVKGVSWRFANALSNVGIQADYPGGVSFYETVEISYILSLLQVIDNPIQDIPLVATLTGPLYRFSPDTLAEIRCVTQEHNFYDAMKQSVEHEIVTDETYSKCRTFLNDIKLYRSIVTDMTSDRFIWYVYNKTSLPAIYGAMKNGDIRRNNLLFLVEYARMCEQNGYKGLFEFLNFVQASIERGEDPTDGVETSITSSDKSIKIMTVHKSKGLEFPIVFLVNTAKRHNLADLRESLVFHKDLGIGAFLIDRDRRVKYSTLAREAIKDRIKLESLSEELRILYVAMTRAKEKLIISFTSRDIAKTMEKLAIFDICGTQPELLSSLQTHGEWILAAIRNESNDNLIVNTLSAQSIENAENRALKHPQMHSTSMECGEDALTNVSNITASKIPDFDFVYKHKNSIDLPSKLTITAITKLNDEDTATADWVNNYMANKAINEPPRFISGKEILSGAKKGTLLHLVLQHIDYKMCSSESETWKELQQLVKMNILNEVDIDIIDIKQIVNFVKSQIGVRMTAAKTLNREFKFSILTPANEIYQNGVKDKILVQGIIDCFFEEDNKLVLVDFKSDKINNNMHSKIEQYTPQLTMYAKALERITGREIKEKVIYFLDNGNSVSV
ncbi:MAG: helicase-exonuclease AddAB subunit AddA [Oscillospiraceae bacterium]|jgi:ATP-dependent helicase/nuclease subunit A|nr:helicase-exonuclease AddAB subunit AddA [Oscillospiraceae bacterium]